MQILQQDSLLSASELGLASSCPGNVNVQPFGRYFQHILYKDYRWSAHNVPVTISVGGGGTTNKICIVLWPEDFDAVAALVDFLDALKKYNETHDVPIRYLSTNQAQVLRSASRGIGFEEKGFNEEAEYYNQLWKDHRSSIDESCRQRLFGGGLQSSMPGKLAGEENTSERRDFNAIDAAATDSNIEESHHPVVPVDLQDLCDSFDEAKIGPAN